MNRSLYATDRQLVASRRPRTRGLHRHPPAGGGRRQPGAVRPEGLPRNGSRGGSSLRACRADGGAPTGSDRDGSHGSVSALQRGGGDGHPHRPNEHRGGLARARRIPGTPPGGPHRRGRGKHDHADGSGAALAGLGKLESVNVNAEDVGEEFTDVTARMGNARRLEARLIDLLATRTGKLKDVLDVERELARVREEIERYEGRLRYLRAHAVLSTLTIYVHEPLPVVGHAGSSVIGEAFKQSWRNFVGLVAAMIRSLGIVIPVAVLVVALWVSAKRLSLPSLRSAARSPGSAPAAPGPSC